MNLRDFFFLKETFYRPCSSWIFFFSARLCIYSAFSSPCYTRGVLQPSTYCLDSTRTFFIVQLTLNVYELLLYATCAPQDLPRTKSRSRFRYHHLGTPPLVSGTRYLSYRTLCLHDLRSTNPHLVIPITQHTLTRTHTYLPTYAPVSRLESTLFSIACVPLLFRTHIPSLSLSNLQVQHIL